MSPFAQDQGSRSSSTERGVKRIDEDIFLRQARIVVWTISNNLNHLVGENLTRTLLSARNPLRVPSKESAIRRQLDGIFELHCVDFDQIGGIEPAEYLLLDVELSRNGRAGKVKDLLSRKPKDAKVIFAIDKTSHLQSIQVTALHRAARIGCSRCSASRRAAPSNADWTSGAMRNALSRLSQPMGLSRG